LYSYLAVDTSPDAVTGPGAGLVSSPSNGLTACATSKPISLRIRRFHGRAITLAKVYVDGRLVLRLRGRSLRAVRLAGLAGSGMHRVRVWEYTRKGLARRVTRRVRGCG
jgi:hypothetical protein